MRLVKNIPHPHFLISVFSLSDKYLLQIEYGPYLQGYKVNHSDMMEGTEGLEKAVSKEFVEKCLKRFKEMHEDFLSALN